MEKLRYLTRYNGQKGTPKSFQGWRLCITRRKETFVRYFTDLEHGSCECAMQAAMEMRDAMLAEMEQGKEFPELCRNYRKRAARA
ncbi:MAG: hypothetical protein IJ956_04155 [Akkermansia sp.]|nr:hypothetical protein [Akkermansia sp.]